MKMRIAVAILLIAALMSGCGRNKDHKNTQSVSSDCSGQDFVQSSDIEQTQPDKGTLDNNVFQTDSSSGQTATQPNGSGETDGGAPQNPTSSDASSQEPTDSGDPINWEDNAVWGPKG